MKCASPNNCGEYYHIRCAQEAGYLLRRKNNNQKIYPIYCPKHQSKLTPGQQLSRARQANKRKEKEEHKLSMVVSELVEQVDYSSEESTNSQSTPSKTEPKTKVEIMPEENLHVMKKFQ